MRLVAVLLHAGRKGALRGGCRKGRDVVEPGKRRRIVVLFEVSRVLGHKVVQLARLDGRQSRGGPLRHGRHGNVRREVDFAQVAVDPAVS